MYCIKCGNELIEGSRFCNNCGHPVGKPLVDCNDFEITDVHAYQQRPLSQPQRIRSEEELEELRTRRLPIGRGILSVLCPPGGIAFTIVNYCTHRKRAGKQALICTIIGFALWTALYIWSEISDSQASSTLYDNGFDWYDL